MYPLVVFTRDLSREGCLLARAGQAGAKHGPSGSAPGPPRRGVHCRRRGCAGSPPPCRYGAQAGELGADKVYKQNGHAASRSNPRHTTQCKGCWREQKGKMCHRTQDAMPRWPENPQSTKTNKPTLQFLRSFSLHLDVPRFPFHSPFCGEEIIGEENLAHFHTCVSRETMAQMDPGLWKF